MSMNYKAVNKDDNTRKGTFRRPRAVRVDASGDTLTEQSHAKECDVNYIMDKFRKTGALPQAPGSQPQFIDLTGVPDFQVAHNKVAEARVLFESLPAAEREKYGNKPHLWIEGKLEEGRIAHAKRIKDEEYRKVREELEVERKKPKKIDV